MRASATVIAIVPARGGSKGIPGKNLQLVAGRPLLAWTIDAAREAATVGRVIVSTDDDDIAAAAIALGAEVPFRRPAQLATDDAPMLGVLQHALEELDPPEPTIVVLLQPTSPLRRSEHIEATVAALRDSNATSAVTVVNVPHAMTPSSLMTMDRDGRLRAVEGAELAPATRRQDKPVYVARNGPAVVATWAATVRSGSLYGERAVGVRMSKVDSIDVDDPDDLVVADALLRR